MNGIDHRILFALEWVKSVKQPILDVYYSLDHFDLKSNNTEVTEADRNTEAQFRKILQEQFPDDGIIGEEYSEQNNEGREYTWTIDPIDGTRAFTRGVPFFGTMLSLCSGDKILFGLIAFHALGETIYAIKDKGCFWNSGTSDEPVSVCVSQTNELDNAVLSFSGDEYFKQANRDDFIDDLRSKVQFWRTWGDCYGYCLLARGKIDIMCDPQLNQWDLVPIKIIVEEAGGLFLDFDGSNTTVNSINALCANPTLMKKILASRSGT